MQHGSNDIILNVCLNHSCICFSFYKNLPNGTLFFGEALLGRKLRYRKLFLILVSRQVYALNLSYLDTWSGFEAAKAAPWPSRGLHHCGKFLEPSDEWAGRGCYCFLMRWHIVGHLWLIRIEKLVEPKFKFFRFNTFDVSQIFWQRVVQPRPNTVIAFSWRDCAGFLFVGYWITHCVPCLGCFLVFIVCQIVPSIFGTICCVTFQIYIII